jgi:hypothetical protein
VQNFLTSARPLCGGTWLRAALDAPVLWRYSLGQGKGGVSPCSLQVCFWAVSALSLVGLCPWMCACVCVSGCGCVWLCVCVCVPGGHVSAGADFQGYVCQFTLCAVLQQHVAQVIIALSCTCGPPHLLLCGVCAQQCTLRRIWCCVHTHVDQPSLVEKVRHNAQRL